jgi:electron transfer flavoprotein alpha subunit
MAEPYTGPLDAGTLPRDPAVWAVLDPSRPKASAASLRAARTAADLFGRRAFALDAAPRNAWPGLSGLCRANGCHAAYCIDTGDKALSEAGKRGVLDALRKASAGSLIAGPASWNDALAMTAGKAAANAQAVRLVMNCSGLARDPAGHLTASVPAYDGRLMRSERIDDEAGLLSFPDEAELPAAAEPSGFAVLAVDLELEPAWTAPLAPAPQPSLATAEVIIDLGYGIRDRTGIELAKELKTALGSLGLAPMFGATRKVTQDLKLLPLEAQIGQTGARVNPKLVIALGISGAPQHIDWVGTRAEILCFNKDTEAPLMKLNQTRPAPRVHPIPGDLFVTVRELIGKLSG